METELRNAIRKLLEEKTVDVAIGYGRVGVGGAVGAVFVTSPDEVDQLVWNNECRQNLAVHLTRPEIKALGKIAIVVKACDARAVVVLANESQIKREEIVVVGVVCEGVVKARFDGSNGEQFFERLRKGWERRKSQDKPVNEKTDWDYNADKKATEEEIDRILDKIRKNGYASLTKEEKQFLFESSNKNR